MLDLDILIVETWYLSQAQGSNQMRDQTLVASVWNVSDLRADLSKGEGRKEGKPRWQPVCGAWAC